jgi:neurofibromin 1
MKATIESSTEIPERTTASVALEVAFLVHLCSSDLDICSTITSSLAVLCEEGRLMESMNDLARSPLTIMRNFEVYSELSSQNFRLTGQVAFQKRFRRLLSKMSRPTAGILTAWEAVFMRWKTVCRHILSFQSGTNIGPDDRTLMEWRNYSGFLAALGGVCIAEVPQTTRMDDSMVAGLRWIDRLSPDGDGMSSLDRFMKLSLQLLTCNNVVVREATREVLGTELSPRLYLQLFQSLEGELEVIFDNSTDITNTESRVLFAEQAASLLRTIVDRLDDSHNTFFSVDFGSLALDLARYVHSLKDGIIILRVKIKICQLCEAVTRKRELLNLRHDVRIRNHLFQMLFEWMSRPGSPRNDSTVMVPGGRRDEMSRLQRDLDRACLKALVDIAYRLPLQPSEGHSDADTSDAKSQLFQTYFHGFLSLLSSEATEQDRRKELSMASIGREESSSSLELAITALSNLLSANVDVGLKHSLEIGYHEDIDIRTAFMRVLSNILLQGTEFDSLSDSAISEKYDRLLEVPQLIPSLLTT